VSAISVNRRIVALAVPAVVTLVADPLMGLVDTAVVGRLGAAELGALGLAVAVLTTVSWVFNFLVFGTTSTVAKAVGAGDRHAPAGGWCTPRRSRSCSGWWSVAGCWCSHRGCSGCSARSTSCSRPGPTYLRVRAVGVPFLLLAYVGHGAFRGVSDTRTPLGVVVVANVINAVLTFGLVFGLGWGIAGAAWATVVAEVAAVAAFACSCRGSGCRCAGTACRPSGSSRRMVVVSRDLFLRTGGLLLGLLAITSAAARTGAVTAAAHQVLFQSFLLVSFLMDGIAIAAQALVGTALGAGSEREAREVARATIRWGVVGGAVIAGVLLAGSAVLPRLLTDDPAVLAAVATAWWLAAIGHVINGPVFALDGVLMGAEDFAYLRTWTVTAAVVGGVGGQLVATFGGGLLGLWVAVQAMMLVRLVSLALRARGTAWVRTGMRLVTGAE
jgi:putative MATE family efflux protein